MAGKIFLNYRRGDDAGSVGRIFDRLELSFAKDHLFMDVEGHIKAGDDYVEVLRKQVAECDVLLAVIGPRWLTITDDTGRKRLENPADWVRVEIASALEAGSQKRVIPVLVGGAPMPRAEDLPDELQNLARKQAVRITLERFRSDTQGLVEQISQVLEDLEDARTAGSETQRTAAEAELKRQDAEQAERVAAAEVRAREQRQAGLSSEEIRKAEELANWEFIKGAPNVHEFRDHLARFPNGVVQRQVQTKLEALTWTKLKNSADAESIKEFLAEFPSGAFQNEGRQRLAALDKEAARVAEEDARREAELEDWAAASAGETKAIEDFLRQYPNGSFASAARARLVEVHGQRTSQIKKIFITLLMLALMALVLVILWTEVSGTRPG